MRTQFLQIPALLAALMVANAAVSAEVFAGAAAHGLDFGLVSGRYEGGMDIVAGVRTAPVARLAGAEVRLHGFAQANLDGGVAFAAAGASLRWPLGKRLYIAPGLGLALHTGAGERFQASPDRLYLGSRVLLEPELSLGLRLSDRWAVEVNYVHLSHAQLAGGQNPGLDSLGARLVYRFGGH